MTSVGVRELNQNTSRLLARVKAGETVEITEHGEPIAVLSPVRPGVPLLERLVALGEAQAATGDLPDLPPAVPGDEHPDIADELAAARLDERW